MRVLIADDDVIQSRIVARALEHSGFEVSTVSDGTAAWERLIELVPAIAILDWSMPGLDGLELCRRIRATAPLAHMYTLLLTGRTGSTDVVAGLTAGADDYLTKPIDLDILRARVQVGVRAAEAMAERERLLDSTGSILVQVDAAGTVTRWNAAAQQTFGVQAHTVVGRSLCDCVAWADPTLVSSLFAPTTRADVGDLAFVDTAGSTHLVTLTVTTLHTGGFVAFGAEVTTRRALEEQLRQAQKLESVGQLAAGIAHEINTPMQYVGDNVRFLQDVHSSLGGLFEALLNLRHGGQSDGAQAALIQTLIDEVDRADLAYVQVEMPKAIQQSLEGVQQVSRIVKAMKDFSHPGTETKVAVDLNRAIETTLTVARNELKYVADTDTDLDPDLPLVPCLPGEINQVLLNLLINAAHAIGDEAPDGRARGRITVSTRYVDDVAEIRVSDTGTGIPESYRSRIFEPFFTTKPVGHGTGQGLAQAHSAVVKRHGGRIWFETEVGVGTTFIVRLPLDIPRPS